MIGYLVSVVMGLDVVVAHGLVQVRSPVAKGGPCPLASFASYVATRRKQRQQFSTSGTAIIAYV